MIHLKHLHFSYDRQDLFSDLNLTIPAGRICGLLGKNGVGKTTLLKLLAGLRFTRSGECRVLNHTCAKRPVGLLQDLYFLPEEFELPAVSVTRYLDMFAPFYPRFNTQRFAEYMQRFELDSGKTLNTYSFGQKKKYILAFGLATDTRILLLDEPTNGLDIPSKSQFRKALASEFSEDRLIIISTHQARDLENIIDSVVILGDGAVLFNQALAEVSDQLSIHFQTEQPDPDTVLYVENVPGGYSVVTKDRHGRKGTMDLEIIFNTVVSNPGRISQIFGQMNKEASHDD